MLKVDLTGLSLNTGITYKTQSDRAHSTQVLRTRPNQIERTQPHKRDPKMRDFKGQGGLLDINGM